MSDLTQTQFIVQMVAEYKRRCPDVPTEDAMRMAATTYKEFVTAEGIEFGDPAFAWDRSAAATLVGEAIDFAQ